MAEYQGKSVTLNKPSRIGKGEPGHGRKKFKVYVKDGDKVKKVMFGDPNMEIRKDNPEARKSFRARHKCDTASDKTTPRYWSCKMWQIMAKIPEAALTSLKKKAKDSGISLATLKKVYKRGQGAYLSSGSRNVSMAAWAMGRVNSFIKGSKKHDKDLR